MPNNKFKSEKESIKNKVFRFFKKLSVQKFVAGTALASVLGLSIFNGIQINDTKQDIADAKIAASQTNDKISEIKQFLGTGIKHKQDGSNTEEREILVKKFLGELSEHPPADEEIEKILKASENSSRPTPECVEIKNKIQSNYNKLQGTPFSRYSPEFNSWIIAYELLCQNKKPISSTENNK